MTFETPGCFTCPLYRRPEHRVGNYPECAGMALGSAGVRLPIRGIDIDDTPPKRCPLRSGEVKVRGVGTAFKEESRD